MPLVQGCSDDAVKQNIKRELASGRSREQAVAIALDVAWRNRGKCSLNRQYVLSTGRLRRDSSDREAQKINAEGRRFDLHKAERK